MTGVGNGRVNECLGVQKAARPTKGGGPLYPRANERAPLGPPPIPARHTDTYLDGPSLRAGLLDARETQAGTSNGWCEAIAVYCFFLGM